MTFREKLQMEHPECVDGYLPGGLKGCPLDYGYEQKRNRSCVYVDEYINECEECWDREIPGTEEEEKQEHDPVDDHIQDLEKAVKDLEKAVKDLKKAVKDLKKAAKNLEKAIEVKDETEEKNDDKRIKTVKDIMMECAKTIVAECNKRSLFYGCVFYSDGCIFAKTDIPETWKI